MAGEELFKFDKYLREDLEKTLGLRFPVKASWLEQLLTRHLSPWKLHANATDEFCSKDVGPSYEIIQKYVESIQLNQRYAQPFFSEPVIIEKMRPDGYLLLNGHHRWAASLKLNLPRIPVKLVNMTHSADIVKMLKRSTAEMRASINLEMVVFAPTILKPAGKNLLALSAGSSKDRAGSGSPRGPLGRMIWDMTSGYIPPDMRPPIISAACSSSITSMWTAL